MKKKEFFNYHAPSWKQAEKRSSLLRVIRESGLKKGCRVCDVGTGTGVLIPFILRAVGPEGSVVAIDYAPVMIDEAKKRHSAKNLSFVIADIHHTDFDDSSFDALFCNACFPHFRNKSLALKEIARILKPEGLLVLSHPTGRESVNQCHRDAGGPVGRDRVPSGVQAGINLKRAGFYPFKMIDEPEFYLLAAIQRS
ncbi:MAG: class I SAM-dependent methyltransferase [Candidatus Ratteibacteria bacterium]|jgi:ubiquinone/menaquinone biosynthesis C-methylase UbiE